jgi:phosphoribosyl 1,2-cyclic phosphodiesterase
MVGITVLGSGSSGNSLVVHGRGGDILVDAGFSLKELRRRMAVSGVDESRICALVVSHEHSDHTKGLGPISRGLGVPVYCTRETCAMLRDRKLVNARVNLFSAGVPFELEGITVQPVSIPHDAVDPVGFTFSSDSCKIGVATDLGHVSGLVRHHLAACDALVVETNHDIEMLHVSSRPWRLKQRILGRHGHLSNNDGLALLSSILADRTRHLVLAHASRECNDYALVQTLTHRCLTEAGRKDVSFQVAQQDESLATIWAGG